MFVSDVTGCINVDVEVTPPENDFELVARSHAQIGDIAIKTHAPFVATKEDVHWDDHHDMLHTFTWHHVSANDTPIVKSVGPNIQWEVLAAATWMFQRNDFNITQGVSRSCCTEGAAGYNLDGTCPVSDYSVVDQTIHYFMGPGEHNGGCPSGGGNGFDGHPEAVFLKNHCASKWLVAHETGHLIVGMRMGDLEEYSGDAPLDGCMGDYNSLGEIDPGGTQARGTFTKEYGASALREGWGEFVAIWAWNSRQGDDCVYHNRGFFSDFDLDGTVDNDFVFVPVGPPFVHDYDVDCLGTPHMLSDSPLVMDDANWLEDLENYPDSSGCVSAPVVNGVHQEWNRLTVYDVAKFFWVLNRNDGWNNIGVPALTDLYIDTCPRGWAEEDNGWDDPGGLDALPLERLYQSAQHHDPIEERVAAAIEDYLD